MKLKFILFINIICLANLSGFGQKMWKRISPSNWNLPMDMLEKGPGEQVLAMKFNNYNVVTLDGVNWQNTVLDAEPNSYPSFIAYASPSIVFAGTRPYWFNKMVLHKSLNGGKTWTMISDTNHILKMVFYPGSQTGFALWSNSGLVRIMKTTDQGSSWSFIPNSPVNFSGQTLVVNSETELWSFENTSVLKSTDAGQTWTSHSLGPQEYIRSVKVNGQFGYAATANKIFKTTNGGSSWVSLSVPQMYSLNVYFKNEQEGWLQDEPYFSDKVYKTSNGGVSWQLIPQAAFKVQDMYMSGQGKGWAYSLVSGLLYTDNNGQTWRNNSKITGENVLAAAFQGHRSWIGGGNTLMYSDDKGNTWTRSSFADTLGHILEIAFTDSLNGIVAGKKRVMQTGNGGLSWVVRPSPVLNGTKARFTNQNLGAFHNDTALFITQNGGQTWIQSPLPNPGAFGPTAGYSPVDIQMLNQNEGYLSVKVVDMGNGNPVLFTTGMRVLYKTIDGGSSWNQVPGLEPGFHTIGSFDFLTAQVGVVGRVWGDSSLSTLDGGNTFTKVRMLSGNGFESVRKIFFLADTLCYALSNRKGSLLKSTNQGLTWSHVANIDSTNIDSVQAFRNVAFLNSLPAVAVGDAGVIYANSDWSGLRQSYIQGRIVKKENQDCIQDPGEIPLPNRVVRSSPGLYFASSDQNGFYSLPVDTGENLIAQVLPHPLVIPLENQYCPPNNAPLSAMVQAETDTVKDANFINDIQVCPFLVLQVTQPRIQLCRKQMLFIKVQNLGTLISDTTWVHVKMPNYLVFLSADRIYDYNATDSTFRFKIAPIPVNGSITISIVDSLSCLPTYLLGKTLCIKATIPNAPNCLLQSPVWDGADLEVASECLQTGQTRFKIHNKGQSMAAASQYQIFIDSALVYQAPFQLAASGQMSVTLPANAPAGFVRLVVPQSQNHPLSTFASAEANCATGQSSNGMFPPPDQSPLVDIECVTVTNSYDPNDKLVFPKGWGPAGNVEPETEFKYTIRFQNTGTDTAFKVVLADTLDQNLDIASLQIGNASHPYQFNVSGKGRPVLTWTFDNILLPDSGANMEKSNGFVSFSIRPKTGLPLGTRLENFADIYFDFNDPVRTNTTVNTLWRPTLTEGILDTVFVTGTNPAVSPLAFSLFPNPSKGLLEVNSSQKGDLQVFDLQGVLVEDRPLEQGKNTFNFSALAKGMYILKITSTMGVQSRKLVLE